MLSLIAMLGLALLVAVMNMKGKMISTSIFRLLTSLNC